MTNILTEGSSKIFISRGDRTLMTFKDDIHGAMRTDQITGTGKFRKIFTYHFYRYMQARGINTHLDDSQGSALTDAGIFVHMLQPIKIEILVRNVARGHWCDDHKFPIFEGGEIFKTPIVEFCLKWKHQRKDGTIIDDPRISPELIIALHSLAKDPNVRGNMLVSLDEAEKLRTLALDINNLYQELLREPGWILEDFKFEVGIDKDRNFILIDEISPDSSRIRDKSGASLTKDLFRQKKSQHEIVLSYELLAQAAEKCLSMENSHE
ncbi:MAG: hypothetical protein COC15_04340 [Legionellales bacterium]|nr:MAG: hypothetical protein COC15_04340 [Legionellales bacterium]